MKEKNIDEKSTAGASYIIQFYKEVQQLKATHADYINLLLELENKYGGNMEKAAEEEKAYIKNLMQTIRKLVIICHVSYKGLVTTIDGLKTDSKLNGPYEKIKSNFVIDRGALEIYVEIITAFLLKDIVSNLLETSQAIINNIFENAQ